MALISIKSIDLIEQAFSAESPAAVGMIFFNALQIYGVSAIFARGYRTKMSTAGEDEHVFSRISPQGWESLYAERRFQEVNYLPREVRRRTDPFRWSDITLTSANERALAQTLIDCGFEDGLAIPAHGPGGYIGVISLAFERLSEVDPSEQMAITFAGLVLHNRMHGLSRLKAPETIKLSPRERDCVAFIAQGKSDWEISVILGVAETTVISHVQNAKRKLGATTRAQAVAKCLTLGLL